MSPKKPTVVVLDRDGVINEDSPDYIKSPNEWHAIPGSLDAIAR
jgi:D-glycero-D-manno-heptose 1,7-bisphosphate phosphatase